MICDDIDGRGHRCEHSVNYGGDRVPYGDTTVLIPDDWQCEHDQWGEQEGCPLDFEEEKEDGKT